MPEGEGKVPHIIYLLCHIYPGVPHQCAALFSLGLLLLHKEAKNVTCGTCSCIAISATKNGYNNQTIASENFTGILNRQEMTDTSRADTSRRICHVSVFGEKGMKNLLLRC